ncbi:MAG: NAD-dependent dehydratase [Bacteroidales bacterium]
MKKVLITGASGFIGGFLVEEALGRGYETWAGVRAGSSRARLQDSRIRFIDLQYNDVAALTAQLKDFANEHGAWNYVIHNAGITKTSDKKKFFRVNAAYTGRLIEALAAADCKPEKFLLMSSLSVRNPDTAYGRSKLEAEKLLRNQTSFPYVILRPTGVYGPGDKDYFMAIKSIQSGFDFAAGFTPQRLTFIYVKDLAKVAFAVLENASAVNTYFFVADGDVHTDAAFARLVQAALGKKRVWRIRVPLGLVYLICLLSEWIGKILGKSMTLNSDKYLILRQRDWTCDITPLRDAINFTAAYPLQRGLEESIAWYRKAGWL